MGRRTSKTASDGTKTVCDACGKAVRGQKGLKTHMAVCTGKAN
ncbi:hypothetical protein [Ruegeria arenilitoris]|nr:hypothetical protein [Ruegeria arenilitoris]